MKKRSPQPHIPELGELLIFILDCFDIPKNESPLTYKQVERLNKGKDLSEENMEKIARSVTDVIYAKLKREDFAQDVTRQILEEWQKSPPMMSGLAYNDQAQVVLPKHQLLKDLLEFCGRHQFLLSRMRHCQKGEKALFYWLSGFVIPYVTSTMVDYYFTADNPDSGMPGGWLWYLPRIEKTQAPDKPAKMVMPSQQVLLWWEDLLGQKLEDLGKQLCGPGSDRDNARRQIAAWREGARPPSFAKIEEWTGQKWDYQGVFKDDPKLPLIDRWINCYAFLQGKGLLGESDWIDSAEKSPFSPERGLTENYWGERLEQEIPPSPDFPFKRFFESKDPIGENLPVEALIQKVALRWRIPTPPELQCRLIIGRAMNKAWEASSKTIGGKSTLDLFRWASCAYNHYMELCMRSDVLSASQSMQIHRQTSDPADPAFHTIAAMLDESYWENLPEYLSMWIRDEVVFRD